MTPLAYLQSAIDFKRQYTRGDHPFLDTALIHAIDRALETEEDPLLLPGKDSLGLQAILPSLASASMPAALYWLEKRGPRAWAQVPGFSSPLIGILDPHKMLRHKQHGFNSDTTKEYSFRLIKEEGLLDLMKSGIEHGMPVRGKGLTMDWMNEYRNRDMVDDQLFLVNYLLSINTRYVDEKMWQDLWSTFQKHDGALILPSTLLGDEVADKNAISPSDVVWVKNKNAFTQGPWIDLWRSSGQSTYMSLESKRVIRWLGDQGLSLQSERDMVFAQHLEARMKSAAGGEDVWSKIKESMSAYPCGWEIESEGTLLWQDLLGRSPTAIPFAAKSPPPTGLAQKSKSGKGLWAAINPQHNKAASVSALSALHAKLKVEHEIDMSPWKPTGLSFARATMKTGAAGWVSEPGARQTKWAAKLLGGLCSNDFSVLLSAVQTCRLLSEFPESRATFGPSLRAVLWVGSEMQVEGRFKRLGVDDNKPFSAAPEPPDKAWAPQLLAAIQKIAQKGISNQEAVGTAQSLLERAALQLAPAAPLPSRPSRRM